MKGIPTRKECFYDILNVERKATDDEVKKAFRQLALKWHPDKNTDTADVATKQFQLIQEAYEVLSDSQERAWYDCHREEILSGGLDCNGSSADEINLWNHFRADCFQGFSDDPEGYYSVYRNLFERINADEMAFGECSEIAPSFGYQKYEWKMTREFYDYWENFYSQKYFASADKWTLKEAQNRQVKRIMKQENEVCRRDAKIKYNERIKALVGFVKKKDPRVTAWKRAKTEEDKKIFENLAKLSKDLENSKQASRAAVIAAENLRFEEQLIERERAKAAGQIIVAEEDQMENDGSDDGMVEVYMCDVCKKYFKTVNQLQSHNNSKKHRMAVKKAAAGL